MIENEMNAKGNKSLLERFRVLTEYECGRAQMAIEWVARSQKPIVEIGGRPLKNCNIKALARDLNLCIAQSGECVRGFIMPDSLDGYCCYGFYRFPWAVKALLSLCVEKQWSIDPYHRHWLQGLLFGYSADAIQSFISSRAHETNEYPVCSEDKVEIYHKFPFFVEPHSNQIDKCQELR